MTSFVQHPRPLTTRDELEQLAETLSGESIIAFDTEFIRESTFFPGLEIIQVATSRESWLIDTQAFLKRHRRDREGLVEEMQPIINVFRNTKILKILHASQGDQECLYTAFKILAAPILDTAVAAGLVGIGDGVGLAHLLKSVLGIKIKKGHARTNWAARPLPGQLVDYAHLDVVHLVELGRKMLEKLDALGRRDWALELSAEFSKKENYQSNPEEMANRMAKGGKVDSKTYPVLVALMTWRERRVRELNVPRRRLADDGTILDLSRVCPRDIGHLNTFRGLNKREVKERGRELIALIEQTLEKGEVQPPVTKSSRVPSTDENRAMSLLKCYIALLADEREIASRHLVPSDQILSLIRSDVTSPQEWVADGFLSEGASQLIGKDLLDFVRGKKALSIDRSQIKVHSV